MVTELTVRSGTGVFAQEKSVSVGCGLEKFLVTGMTGLFDPEESQAYFWTEEWQKGEREADEDIRAGRVTVFDSADDALQHLRDL